MADLIKENEKINESETDNTKTTTVNVTKDDKKALKKAKQTSNKESNNRKSDRKPSNFVSYLAIFISLGALGTSGWQYYQDLLHQDSNKLVDLESSQQQLSTLITEQTNALSNLQTQVGDQVRSQLTNQLKPTLDKLTQDNKFTQDNNTRVNFDISVLKQQFKKLNNTTKEDWKLAEAEYLIRLANQRLLMEKDIIGAQQMLINADDILVQLDDPLLFATRKALASDIEKLKATPSFDLEGIYLQLEALTIQINSLPQKGHQRRISLVDENTSHLVKNEKIEQSLVDELWATIKSLIIIKRHDKPIAALLPPAEYQQIILNLKMQLNAAQLALLKQEPTIYKIALTQTATIITDAFDLNDLATQSFLTSIKELQAVNPSPDLPLPRDSLVAIKAIAAVWHNTTETTE